MNSKNYKQTDTTFSDAFETKYKAENFTDTDSNTDTNPYSHMVARISHQMSYLPLNIKVAAYIYKVF